MAEFEYVMRQASRMCAAQSMCSDKCPAYAQRSCCVSPEGRGIAAGIDYAGTAKAVLDWAKAHPEPVYPSWEEGWRQLFPDTMTAICPIMCVTGDLCDKYYSNCKSGKKCDECRQAQIPAEIAKKLGIEPKEV